MQQILSLILTQILISLPLLNGLNVQLTNPTQEDTVEYIDLVEDITGAFKYVPEKSAKCPSAYALVVTKEHSFIRSYCDKGEKFYAFGKMQSIDQNTILETSSYDEENKQAERQVTIEFLDMGFKYNKDSTLLDCEVQELPEAKLAGLFGDFEEADKRCRKFKYISFYPDGQYQITKCPTETGKVEYEDGIFTIQYMEGAEVSLELVADTGYKYDFILRLDDKDHLFAKYQKLPLRRCIKE